VDGVSGTPTLTVGDNDATGAENTFSGVIKNTAGTLSLTKIGNGTLTLSGTNTYGGNTTINAGKLQLVVGGSCSNSTVILAATTATNSVSVTANTMNWTCSNLTASAAGVLEFNFGSIPPSPTVSPLNIRSNATFTVTPAVSVLVNTGLASGTYPLMTWGASSGTVPTTANLTLSAMIANTSARLSVSGNTLNLVIYEEKGTVFKIR
jgi:autotransporter-associated beta strand protein